MLTNFEIEELAHKMNIDCIQGCYYKDELISGSNIIPKPEPNKAYIINLASSHDNNDGTHWTCLYSRKNRQTSTIDYIYFDSTGCIYPNEVLQFVGRSRIPYNKKQIQSQLNNACGFWVLAFLYWISVWEHRSHVLYVDCEDFLGLFDDNLNDQVDIMKNEFILSQFFQEAPIDGDMKESIVG